MRLELMDWQIAKEVAYLVGTWLATELGWTIGEEDREVDKYEAQLDQFMQRADVKNSNA